jgi:hypothetical protein
VLGIEKNQASLEHFVHPSVNSDEEEALEARAHPQKCFVYLKIALPNIIPEQNKFRLVRSFCVWKRNLEEQGGIAFKGKGGLPC